jgi:hypothetical protein
MQEVVQMTNNHSRSCRMVNLWVLQREERPLSEIRSMRAVVLERVARIEKGHGQDE